jgi:hypothetical protein
MTEDTTTPETDEVEEVESEEGFIAGIDRETAARALEAAEVAGADASVVRTAPFEGGLYVPKDVLTEYEKLSKKAAKAAEKEEPEQTAEEQNAELARTTAEEQAKLQADADDEAKRVAEEQAKLAQDHVDEVNKANGVKPATPPKTPAKTAAK